MTPGYKERRGRGLIYDYLFLFSWVSDYFRAPLVGRRKKGDIPQLSPWSFFNYFLLDHGINGSFQVSFYKTVFSLLLRYRSYHNLGWFYGNEFHSCFGFQRLRNGGTWMIFCSRLKTSSFVRIKESTGRENLSWKKKVLLFSGFPSSRISASFARLASIFWANFLRFLSTISPRSLVLAGFFPAAICRHEFHACSGFPVWRAKKSRAEKRGRAKIPKKNMEKVGRKAASPFTNKMEGRME